MKKILAVLVIVILIVSSIVPITAFMARYGLTNKDKGFAPGLVFTAGNIRLKLQQHRSAGAIFQKAVEAFPQNKRAPEACYRVGLCYEKLGLPEEAVKWYQDFMARWPQHEWASQAGKRIVNLEANSLQRTD